MNRIMRFLRHKKKHSDSHRDSVVRRISLAADRIIQENAVEYHLTFKAAVDLMCEKSTIKLCEEKEMRPHSPAQMQLEVARAVARYGIEGKAKDTANQTATPKKQSPGETPGAVSH